jgi:uncharacterized protein with FMN-binding domain
MFFREFIKDSKYLAPALIVLLIIGISVTPTMQAATPSVYADDYTEDGTATDTTVTVMKAPKKVDNSAKAAITISAVEETGKYADGKYSGVGMGFNGNIYVLVTIKGGEIRKIAVTKHIDDQPYMRDAMGLIGSIIKKQSTNVDAVTGATYSSRGIINAVRDALRKALLAPDAELDEKGEEDNVPGSQKEFAENTEDNAAMDEANETADNAYEAVYGMYVDGTYTGLSRGYKSTFKATVVIAEESIADIKIAQADDEDYYKQCVGIIDRIIKRQTTDGVDTVVGCTYSSNGILNSVKAALAKARKPEPPPVTEEGDGKDDGGQNDGGENGDGDSVGESNNDDADNENDGVDDEGETPELPDGKIDDEQPPEAPDGKIEDEVPGDE